MASDRSQEEYVRRLEMAAHATLLFWSGKPWTEQCQVLWEACTGNHEVTSQALCDFIRSVLKPQMEEPK